MILLHFHWFGMISQLMWTWIFIFIGCIDEGQLTQGCWIILFFPLLSALHIFTNFMKFASHLIAHSKTYMVSHIFLDPE